MRKESLSAMQQLLRELDYNTVKIQYYDVNRIIFPSRGSDDGDVQVVVVSPCRRVARLHGCLVKVPCSDKGAASWRIIWVVPPTTTLRCLLLASTPSRKSKFRWLNSQPPFYLRIRILVEGTKSLVSWKLQTTSYCINPPHSFILHFLEILTHL